MCRHLAYLGPPRSVRELVVDPPHSLFRQSWEPERQRHGVVNADGFGIGWFAPGDPEPARYRFGGPIWADPSFADLARVIRTPALLAAVRDATVGGATGAEAAAPYAGDGWLFSHNGAVDGWPGSVAKLAATLAPEELLRLEARTDAALVWALILHRLRDGAEAGQALASVVADVCDLASARLNLLVTDGRVIAATTHGEPMAYLAGPDSVRVASEPDSADPGWTDVPEGSLLVAGLGAAGAPPTVAVSPLTPKAGMR
jgi:glutamine amidotransferase